MSNGVVQVPLLKEAIKSGWLEHLIRQGWLRKRWRNRWVVLHPGKLFLFENQVKDEGDKPSSTISLDNYQAAKTANKKDTKKGQPTLELTPKLQNGKKDAKKALFSAESQEELDKWEEAITRAMQKEKKPAEPGAPLEHVTKTRARPQANKRRPPSRDHLRGKRITTASTGIDLDMSMETTPTENSSPAVSKKRGNRPTQALRPPNRTRAPSGAPPSGEVKPTLNGSTSSLHSESPQGNTSANELVEETADDDKRPPAIPSTALKPPTKGEAPPTPEEVVEDSPLPSAAAGDGVITPEEVTGQQEEEEETTSSNKPPPPPSPACKPKYTPTTTDDDDVISDDVEVVDKQKPPPLPSPLHKPSLTEVLTEVKEEEDEGSEKSQDEDGASFTDDELDEVIADDVAVVADCDVTDDDVETLNANNCNSKSIPTSSDEELPPNPKEVMELPSEVRDALDVLDEQLLDVSMSDDDDEDDVAEDVDNNMTKTPIDSR